MTAREAREVALEGLRDAASALEAAGVPVPPLRGKLLRPLVAYAAVPAAGRDGLDRRFWLGALAIQMAHEASLLHDDVIDGAGTRRGRPTVASSRGVGAALIAGDHFLTGAYRAAAMTGSAAFVELFAEAVERTVAGEVAQARAAGSPLDREGYLAVVTGKSGELFGAAAALHACLVGGEASAPRSLGRRLGALYQQVDDFLDYLPSADRGKPPLQDYRQRKWTWVLGEAGLDAFDLSEEEVLERLRRTDERGRSPLTRCVARLRTLADEVADEHAHLGGDPTILSAVLDSWIADGARAAAEAASRPVALLGSGAGSGPRPVSLEMDGASPSAPVAGDAGLRAVLEAGLAARARSLGGPEAWRGYFGRHARTFRFASRLFPSWAVDGVAEVYAFCRCTDDLVDECPDDMDEGLVADRIDVWREMARRAWSGEHTGVPLLDVTMGRMARAGVPFRYVEGLCEGVASDAGAVRIETMEELERYTWRVAGVVGGWLTRLFGVRDPAILQRAYRLGHAMQLTNILRDVGEDWRAGRLYLPAELLRRYGVDEAAVATVAEAGPPVPGWYRAVLEELIEHADRAYDEALEAVPALPSWYGRPVVVAARAYQGIHDEIRRNDYDNVTRRANTSFSRKVVVGTRALLELATRGGTFRFVRRAGRAVEAPAESHG